jgi:hypothetical protein
MTMHPIFNLLNDILEGKEVKKEITFKRHGKTIFKLSERSDLKRIKGGFAITWGNDESGIRLEVRPIADKIQATWFDVMFIPLELE